MDQGLEPLGRLGALSLSKWLVETASLRPYEAPTQSVESVARMSLRVLLSVRQAQGSGDSEGS